MGVVLLSTTMKKYKIIYIQSYNTRKFSVQWPQNSNTYNMSYHTNLQTEIISRSIRVLESFSLLLAWQKVVDIEAIKKFVNHSNKFNSFSNFTSSSKFKSISCCLTEDLHRVYNMVSDIQNLHQTQVYNYLYCSYTVAALVWHVHVSDTYLCCKVHSHFWKRR